MTNETNSGNGGGYENAPATLMLATHCAICARPLVDAKSVETGIGPECRKRHGFNVKGISDENRKAANKLVYEIALAQSTGRLVVKETLEKADALRALGFDKLAGVIIDRAAVVTITNEPDGRFAVKAPFNEVLLGLMHSIRSRRWDKARKLTTFDASDKRAVFEALTKVFPGCAAVGPKGAFVL